MQSLKSILASVRRGDYLSSIDLTETSLHVSVRPHHRRFLRFCYGGRHYQYRALPFGLSSAPRVFTKILAVLAAYLRLIPVRVQCYLDDIIIQSSSFSTAQLDLQTTIETLQRHGFSVNFKKSHITPTTRILHLGAMIDSNLCKVYLSQEHKDSIKSLVHRIQREKVVPLVQLSQLLGKMISCLGIMPWARLHSRHLQWFLLPFQKRNISASTRKVRVPHYTLLSLKWWGSPAIHKGSLFKEPHRLILTTDTNLFGWGAHIQTYMTQGQWSKRDLAHNINWLELRAIHLALHQFSNIVTGNHVLVMTDNVAAKALINRQGGTKSWSLMQEALALGLWAESHLKSISAKHISRQENHKQIL
ncbi:uncharacterized protein LOC120297791 isoform X1 [Crotalus tigris]|uniref:uncharacterized protein LOC120297791 isoform X1 n=1 Tax=Crotalus tigris TaxID=88082 RepID=UPI00192F4077|nr:uncharacterized protein LOC120297791 isoform X1 [Crotalus tigris]